MSVQVQNSVASPYCFGLAKSTVTGFSLLLAGGLLLKMLSLPRVDAKYQLHPAGQLIWVDCLLYCPGSVVKKSQNMGVNQNLGANPEFTVFHCI